MGKLLKTKKQKNAGITLIALVITIIVLLILAGITINLTIGQDGILKRAQEAGHTYKEAEANEVAQLNSFEASVIPGKVAKTEDGVQYVGDGMGNLIPVPVGFSYLEGTKSTGFVIKNDTDGNEFVWVPCTIDGANGSIKYDRYAFTREGWTYNQTLDNTTGKIIAGTSEYFFTEAMSSDEESSVKTYGGYYIGRYESGVTGHDSEVSESNSSRLEEWTGYNNGTLVIQKDQQVWNYITRDKAKSISEGLYSKSNGARVNSKLCSSYAWDTALKFIEIKYPTYPIDSTQGNYSDKSDILGKPAKTGVTDSVNNIYDMGGNTWEWTTESYGLDSEFGTKRSGHYNTSSSRLPAAHRSGSTPTDAAVTLSFRTTLYL